MGTSPHTSTHGSWLNLIETVFGKMACIFLTRLRVQSGEELKQRILQGIREMNLTPSGLSMGDVRPGADLILSKYINESLY